jgi:GNAT superfamily N-acetyltransferase
MERAKVIEFREARPGDAKTLAQVSERAFHTDVLYGSPGIGGPPGYNSAAWQAKIMRIGDYYAIQAESQIVGGMIVFRKEPREYKFGRMLVDVGFQHQGIGTQAFEFLWQTCPLAKRRTLGTSVWNQRTRHFFRTLGFAEDGEDGHGGILFERQIAGGPARGYP